MQQWYVESRSANMQLIGAGTVVKTDVPDNAAVAGVPTKQIRCSKNSLNQLSDVF